MLYRFLKITHRFKQQRSLPTNPAHAGEGVGTAHPALLLLAPD